MPVEIFTRETFEEALPLHPQTGEPLWKGIGCVKGEYCYRVFFGNKYAEIFIRSSVRSDGISAEKGKDSIRAWLVAANATKDREGFPLPLCKKLQRWVTRQLNWRTHLGNLLKEQSRLGMVVRPCPKCGKPTKVYEITTGYNIGKFASGCSELVDGKWQSHCFDLLPNEFQPDKAKAKHPCPVCGIEMRVVDIRKGNNAGKQALTCPARDDNGNYMNHCFEVLEDEDD